MCKIIAWLSSNAYVCSMQDAFLRFKGPDKYKRLKYVKDVVGNPKVVSFLPICQGKEFAGHKCIGPFLLQSY